MLSGFTLFLSNLGTLLILAQDGTGAAPGGAPGAAPGGGAGAAPPAGPGWAGFVPLIAVALFFYIFLMRPQQQQQAKRQDLLDSLQRNQKVVTIGGMIGTIVDLSPDGQRVTLRVDDNIRLKFLRSSIDRVYDESAEKESKDS